jgi:hypothetical protein
MTVGRMKCHILSDYFKCHITKKQNYTFTLAQGSNVLSKAIKLHNPNALPWLKFTLAQEANCSTFIQSNHGPRFQLLFKRQIALPTLEITLAQGTNYITNIFLQILYLKVTFGQGTNVN